MNVDDETLKRAKDLYAWKQTTQFGVSTPWDELPEDIKQEWIDLVSKK